MLIRSVSRTARDGQGGQFHQRVVLRRQGVANHSVRSIAEKAGNRNTAAAGNFSKHAVLMLFQIDLDWLLSDRHDCHRRYITLESPTLSSSISSLVHSRARCLVRLPFAIDPMRRAYQPQDVGLAAAITSGVGVVAMLAVLGSIRRMQDGERCAIPTWLRRPVDLTAVSDLQDEDRQGVIFHLIDNSIVPTQQQEPFLSAERLYSPRAGVVGQGVDPWLEATLHLWGKSPEVALCSWSEDDTITQGLQLKPFLILRTFGTGPQTSAEQRC